jgi:hypothetical protein
VLYEAYHPGRDTRALATLFSDLLWAGKIMAVAGVCHSDLKCSNVVRVADADGAVRLAVVDFASSFLYTVHGPTGGPSSLLRAVPCATRNIDSPAVPVAARRNPAWCDAFAIGSCCLSILQGDENTLDGFAFFAPNTDESQFGEAHARLKAMIVAKFGGTEAEEDTETYIDGVIAALLLSAPMALYKLASARVDAVSMAMPPATVGTVVRDLCDDLGQGAGETIASGIPVATSQRVLVSVLTAPVDRVPRDLPGVAHTHHDVTGVPMDRVTADWYNALRVVAECVNPRGQFTAGNAEWNAGGGVAVFDKLLALPLFDGL